MSIQNVFDINVDLKQSTVIKTPIITKNDTVVFNVHVYDDGKVFDISEGKTFSIFSKRPDGEVIGKSGTVTGQNTIQFPLGTSETSVPGVVSATIQIYDKDGRVSTFPFYYQVLDDPSIGYVKSSTEVTLLQSLINSTQDVIDSANTAATKANEAASNANTATTKANEAASSANTAATKANEAADNANTQASYAQQQGDYAKAQGDAAKLAANNANDAAENANTQAKNAQNAAQNANDAAATANEAAQNANQAATSANKAAVNAATQTQYAQQQGDYAKAQGDYAKQVGDENKTRWLTAVNTYADIATTYPNPQLGDTVQTIDDGKIYRWNGTQWVWTQQYNANAITDIQTKIGILFDLVVGIDCGLYTDTVGTGADIDCGLFTDSNNEFDLDGGVF